MPNRLAQELSPYLRQHQDNPVDWYSWGPEALSRAEREDRPILLSIGYSACHWCHVMAHESFERPETAALMNRLFVNIKVDREERPDLDDVYQHAVQLMGRHGGWPLTVFLTPKGVPFFGGTYFPSEDRHGLPAFDKVLEGVSEAYVARRGEVETSGRQLLGALQSLQEPAKPELARPEDWTLAVGGLLRRFDEANGGFGGAPKFPNTMPLEVLLRAAADGDARAAFAVHRSLDGMADRGLHDQLGGGFHRYTVDDAWAVPHFEKMLYDNALLANLYLSAGQAFASSRYLEVARGVFDFLERELSAPGGGFYSSLDADSAGPDGHVEEGRFYVWTPAQVAEVVGPAFAPELCAVLGVTEVGNFEESGESVLSRRGEPDDRMRKGMRQLWAARERRPRPFRDDKVLAGWNGLAISAFARGAQVLGDGGLLTRAEVAAGFIVDALCPGSDVGTLRRSWCERPSAIGAFAEDFAFLAVGFLDLYEASFSPRWLAGARECAEQLLSRFQVDGAAAFALAPSDGEPLAHRSFSLYDNAVPGATSAGVEALQRLSWLTGDARYGKIAGELVRAHVAEMAKNPFGFGNLLCGLDRHLRGPVEVVVVGDRSDPRTAALLSEVHRTYLPRRVLVSFAPGQPPKSIDHGLWEGREGVTGQAAGPTAYVCRDHACLAPAVEPAELRAVLSSL